MKKSMGRAAVVLAVAGALGALSVSAATASVGPDAVGGSHPTVRHHHHYGTGALLSRQHTAHRLAVAPKARPDVPDSFSLEQYAAAPGDQGQVGACVSWAIDYSAYSVLENEQGIAGGPQAPMYTYAQIAQGNDQGSTPEQTFQILTSQGVDDQTDYWQGNYDYTTQPDQNETTNAAKWKLSGYTTLSTGAGIQADVENAISSGEPVVITIPVYQSFESISQSQAQDYSYMPSGGGDSYLGEHEIAIIAYDTQGVRVQNSWNSSWGDGGFINLSWNYLENQVEEANAVGKLVTG